MNEEKIAVEVSNEEEFEFIKKYTGNPYIETSDEWSAKDWPHIFLWEDSAGNHRYKKENLDTVTFYTFEEWITIKKINYKNKNYIMKQLMLTTLDTTYNNLILRRRTVPLFMSDPGIGKTTIIHEYLEDLNEKNKSVVGWIPKKMKKITLSQRMPNEVVGMMI